MCCFGQHRLAVVARRICAERFESQQMLGVLAWTLQQVLGERLDARHGEVQAVFERPKAAYEQTADLAVVQRIKKMLGYDCRFDGCVYALKDATGVAMREPWRALTSLACLQQPLSRQCDGTHTRAVTRGHAAERSACYTAPLLEAVGRAVLAYPMRSGEAEEVGALERALNDESGSGSALLKDYLREKKSGGGSDAGKSVRRGLPKPDPSGIATTNPPVSVRNKTSRSDRWG